MKKLTIHLLDVASGESACGMFVKVKRWQENSLVLCAEQKSGLNGRVEPYLLAEEDFPAGQYQLQFYLGDYFAERGFSLSQPRFFDVVSIDIGVADESIHLPLLITPWSYSIYRGS